MPEEIKSVLAEFKLGLEKLYGKRLIKVILYGSWARGEATEGSDVDLTVVLAGQVLPGTEIDRMIDLITEIHLQHNVLIAVYPVSEKAYMTIDSPLLRNIHREGMPA